MAGPTRLADSIQRLLSVRLPFSYQMIHYVSMRHQMDDTLTRQEFGVEPREVNETIADTIRWMVEDGHLSPKLAGILAA